MNHMRYLLSAAFLLLLSACGTGDSARQPKEAAKPVSETGGRFGNGITIRENGLKISDAVLLREDGNLLPPDHTVGIGEVILCRMRISGWHEEQGRVKVGAYEDIRTAGGDLVLKEEDLFRDMTSASAEDAKVVTLRATITKLTRSIHDFKVNFRVWDKVSNADLTGDFRFHLK